MECVRVLVTKQPANPLKYARKARQHIRFILDVWRIRVSFHKRERGAKRLNSIVIKESLWVSVCFLSLSVTVYIRVGKARRWNTKTHHCSFQEMINADFRGDATVPCSARHRVILAMPKSLTLHRVIPFGPSPSPPLSLSIGRSLAYCCRKLFYVCAQPAHRLRVKSAGGVWWFVAPRQCQEGEQVLRSGLLSKRRLQPSHLAGHGCAPRSSFMGPREPGGASP